MLKVSPLLPACFIVSGTASLILQVVWVRKLVEIFGSSTLAIATVLAAFMGGLALGSALGGRLADNLQSRSSINHTNSRTPDPFLFYGIAEAIVGLSALLVPFVIASLRGPNAWLWTQLGDWPTALGLARFALTALVLLVPTTAMGATLPLLVRRARINHHTNHSLGPTLSALYTANTLGAVIGTALAGFVLIPRIGVAATATAAALAALALALVVMINVWRRPLRALSSSDTQTGTAEPTPSPERHLATQETESEQEIIPQPIRTLALLTYAATGAAAMALEVLYSRALAVVNGSSITSFTLVLLVFLAGIALGSALIGIVLTHRDRHHQHHTALLGLLVGAAAAAVAITVWLIDRLPGISASLLDLDHLDKSSIVVVHATITALTIAPAALCFGAIMPVAISIYSRSTNTVGKDVGRAYAANTVGAIIGSVGCGFFLMPWLSMESTLRWVVFALLVIATILIVTTTSGRRRLTTLASIATIALVTGLAPPWNQSDFTTGLFRAHVAETVLKAGELFKRKVLFYADGAATTVSVERNGLGVLILKNNGKVEASSRLDMPTQILVGLMPVVFHPRPTQVFVIGYGSGVTVGAITRDQRVERIDVAEIEPQVLQAADKFFADVNHAADQNPIVHRRIGDGRNVLIASKRRYDVIVSEPSNPWIAGVASLFTREFYQFAKTHLAEGGVFCQWAQLYELGPANVKMIYRTFHQAFPYVYAFIPGDQVTDTILLGANHPIDLSPSRLSALLSSQPGLDAEVKRAEMTSAHALIASVFMLPDDLASFTAGQDLLVSAGRASFATLIRSSGWPYGRLDRILARGEPQQHLRLARAFLEYGRLRQAEAFLQRAPPASVPALKLEQLLELTRRRLFADPELSIVAAGAPLAPISTLAFMGTNEEKTRGTHALKSAYPLIATGQWRKAYQAIRALPMRSPTDAGRDITLLLGYLAYKATRFRRAENLLRLLAKEPEHIERRPAILYYLGRVQYGRGRFRHGVATLAEFIEKFPQLAKQAIDNRL